MRPATRAVPGRRWITRLQRNQKDPRDAFSVLRSRGMCNLSMFRPTNPRTPGNRVTEASMVTSTAAAPPTAIPWTNENPISRIPKREITTVVPAKSTALPAVEMDSTIASSGGSPSCNPCR